MARKAPFSPAAKAQDNAMAKEYLLENIQLLHTTQLGAERIKRNLRLSADDAVEYCKNLILKDNCEITRQGKNWYCEADGIIITVNTNSYTIITAHIKQKTASF